MSLHLQQSASFCGRHVVATAFSYKGASYVRSEVFILHTGQHTPDIPYSIQYTGGLTVRCHVRT